MPELHLPILKQASTNSSKPQKKGSQMPNPTNETKERKREEREDTMDVMVDDDGEAIAINLEDELNARIEALSRF
jgi:putative methyltransferase